MYYRSIKEVMIDLPFDVRDTRNNCSDYQGGSKGKKNIESTPRKDIIK